MADPLPTEQFPVAAIVCISIGGYIIIVGIILLIRQLLMKRGFCGEAYTCCGEEGKVQCCECCITCSESCNCMKSPSVESCLDSICPSRQQYDCADIITCQCCADPNNQCCSCCGGEAPLCDCGQCNCNCQCEAPECQDINCLCFKLKSKELPPDDDD